MANVLVVGAGFAGSVHARVLADAGHDVLVIDKRPHVAGNCYDEVDATGVRVHRYGPHLFHTSNRVVVEWLSRFTEWVPYVHEVVARLPGGNTVPLPVNLDTVNAVFGTEFTKPEEVATVLSREAEPLDYVNTAEDYLLSIIGRRLTELFFAPYTKKMWGVSLAEMAPDVVRRLKIRLDRDPRYFPNDDFQALPRDGYTALFNRMLHHPKIRVVLGSEFQSSDLTDFDHCFSSMPIDVFYDFRFGELPYRSIRFHTTPVCRTEASSHVVVNYTDHSPYTRETWWHNLPAHHLTVTGEVLRTIEEPCDYRDNDYERYYPVKAADRRYDTIYQKYKALADSDPRITFIGRCGTYQYLDMHQVVNQSLMSAKRWCSSSAA